MPTQLNNYPKPTIALVCALLFTLTDALITVIGNPLIFAHPWPEFVHFMLEQSRLWVEEFLWATVLIWLWQRQTGRFSPQRPILLMIVAVLMTIVRKLTWGIIVSSIMLALEAQGSSLRDIMHPYAVISFVYHYAALVFSCWLAVIVGGNRKGGAVFKELSASSIVMQIISLALGVLIALQVLWILLAALGYSTKVLYLPNDYFWLYELGFVLVAGGLAYSYWPLILKEALGGVLMLRGMLMCAVALVVSIPLAIVLQKNQADGSLPALLAISFVHLLGMAVCAHILRQQAQKHQCQVSLEKVGLD